jgi:GcrA cell cycle regulator
MSKSWDSNILKKLKSLMGKGLSTAEIGKKLGISKNAVVGKLHRLGWNAKATESGPKVKKSPTAAKSIVAKKSESKKVTTSKVVEKKSKKAPAPKKTVKPVKTDKKLVSVKASSKKTAKTEPAVKKVAGPKIGGGRPIAGRNLGVHQRIVQHALEMANLKTDQCRWPIGDPDSEGFHFCGKPVFVGKPYCYEHCKQAYQFAPPKKK